MTEIVMPAGRLRGVERDGERYWSERDLLDLLARAAEMNHDDGALAALNLVRRVITGERADG